MARSGLKFKKACIKWTTVLSSASCASDITRLTTLQAKGTGMHLSCGKCTILPLCMQLVRMLSVQDGHALQLYFTCWSSMHTLFVDFCADSASLSAQERKAQRAGGPSD